MAAVACTGLLDMASLSLAVLAPWLPRLCALRIHPVAADVVTDDPVLSPSPLSRPGVWLQWVMPPNASAVAITQSFEAVELLVLLAWASSEAWTAAAVALQAASTYSFASDWARLVLDTHEPPRVLGYDIVCTETDDAHTLCTYLSSPETDESIVSADYRIARTMLEDGLGSIVEIPVRLRLQPRRPWQASHAGVLPSIAAVGTLQQRLSRSVEDTNEPSCRLATLRSRIRYLFDDIVSFTRVDERYLHQLQTVVAMWDLGIHVVDLPRLDITFDQMEGHAHVLAIQSLLGVERPGCVQRVSVGHTVENAQTSTLLSAVAASSSVREVTFAFQAVGADDASEKARRRTVQWLAYACFSGRATNKLAKVSLQCHSLTIDDVDLMRDVVEAEDPLVVLFPDGAETIQRHQALRVSVSNMRLHASATENHSTSLESPWIADLRVLGPTTDAWCVLLPGWGPVWVANVHAIVASVPQEKHTPRFSRWSPSITEIELSAIHASNVGAIQVLIGLIGSHVKTLRLDDRSQEAGAFVSMDALAACPRIEALHLRNAVPDRLLSLSELFGPGRCAHLKHLSLSIEGLTDVALGELGVILNLLANPTHAMSLQLEALDVDAFSMASGDDAVDSDVLDLALAMLQTNTKLVRLRLHLPLAASDVTATQRLEQGFAMHHGELLPSPVAPLGGREKAAFLSVVWTSSYNVHSALHRLDERAVATIFAFAPARRRRVIDVAMPR